MIVLSSLQILPLHVVEAIAHYYIGTHRSSYSSESAKSKQQRNAWLVLYDISYSWRTLALGYFCNGITLTVTTKIEKGGFTFSRLPRSIKKKNNELYNYVKNININICDVIDKPSEEKLLAFYAAWPENVVFPSARSLSIGLIGTIRQPDAEVNIAENEMLIWIAQRIPTSIPMLQQAGINASIFSTYMLKSTALHYIELKEDRIFSSIFGKVKNLKFNGVPIHIGSNGIFMQFFSGFASLYFNCSVNIDLFHCVVQRSAHMLESLDIVNLPCKNLRKLFYDDNDQPITYPKLRKLDYHLVSFVKAEDMLSLDESIVPFPALTHLNWPTTYTFADDTLFRGNSDALEYLNVVFDTNLIDILERYSVFSGGKYSKLRHITASKSYSIHTAQMSFESFARFAISLISPATRSFKMIDHSPCQPLFDTISTNAFAENIQILNLGATKLVLLDMLDLIKLLPNITDFTCLPGGIGSDLGKKRGKSMLDLHADYYPLSHRLKCWVIPYTNSIPVRSIALASISLAILCTNFTFTALPHSKRKVYHSELTKALAIEEYSKYAEKIQLLFYRE